MTKGKGGQALDRYQSRRNVVTSDRPLARSMAKEAARSLQYGPSKRRHLHGCTAPTSGVIVNRIIYIVGLVVIVIAVLSWLGLR